MNDHDAQAPSPAEQCPSSKVAHGCPSCGAALQHVSTTDVGHWPCPECGRCWEPEPERLRRVDPSNCPGCNAHLQAACVAILELDLWHFANETPRAEKPGSVQP